MSASPELPAMLYKHGTEIEWDGEMFDTIIAVDEDELAAALKDGWSVGKPEKKAAKPKAEDGEQPAAATKPKGRGRSKKVATVRPETKDAASVEVPPGSDAGEQPAV